MLRARIRAGFFVLLLTLSVSQMAAAEVKVYQYDGKLPFVQMMLNMMVAMGILDRLPANGLYGGYGASGYPSSWSSLSNPYVRALAMRGITPGTSFSSLQNPYGRGLYNRGLYGQSQYGDNPFDRSPWLQSPWMQPALNGVSPVWGSPSWGVLPTDSYATNDAWNGYRPYWSSDDVNGWVNEPWESSGWNRGAKPVPLTSAQQSPPPLVQNFNFSAAENSRAENGRGESGRTESSRGNGTQSYSPLAKLAPPQPGQMQPGRMQPGRMQPGRMQQGQPQQGRSRQGRSQQGPPPQPPYGQRSSPDKVPQRPCVTEFCGLKKPSLDGLWVAQNGEMLGVKNHRYLWSDSNSRYLTGQLKIQNEYLVANIDGHDTLMRFKYKLAGNRLLTMQEDGVIREFVRTAGGQYGHPVGSRPYRQ